MRRGPGFLRWTAKGLQLARDGAPETSGSPTEILQVRDMGPPHRFPTFQADARPDATSPVAAESPC